MSIVSALKYAEIRKTYPLKKELKRQKKWTLLRAFGTSVSFPADLLETPDLYVVNVYAASPDYPSRYEHQMERTII